MKTKKQSILISALVLFIGTLCSCETDVNAENETIYEVQGIDKSEVEDPNSRRD